MKMKKLLKSMIVLNILVLALLTGAVHADGFPPIPPGIGGGGGGSGGGGAPSHPDILPGR